MKIKDVYKSLFPDGTYVTESGESGWGEPPVNPIDAFAFVAHLLVQSGAYHHVVTQLTVPADRPANAVRRIEISPDDVRDTEQYGDAWRRQPLNLSRGKKVVVPPIVKDWWQTILALQENPVFQMLPSSSQAPDWWKPAVLILMAADHACKGVGYPVKLAKSDLPSKDDWMQAIIEKIRTDAEGTQAPPVAITLSAVPPTILCVTPKSHTSQIGCAIGSLTHNLALLPPQGVVRARWHVGRVNDPMKADANAFRLLLVPFPYTIRSAAFRPAHHTVLGDDWGWFEVDQRWLPKRGCLRPEPSSATPVTPKLAVTPPAGPTPPSVMTTTDPTPHKHDPDAELSMFVKNLIDKARREVGSVDAVVFPELSLDPVSLGVMQRLCHEEGVSFLMAGVSHGPRRAGNYVAVTRVNAVPKQLVPDMAALSHDLNAVTAFRSKHHRWRLDQHQIARYRLGDSLRPDFLWWEKLDITSRAIDVFNFRRNSNLTVLICEDLARIEPCQQAVRAIGPNIVVALLMDGPQTPERWPARYATVLADDPGCAVLSFTSLGLIDRSHRHDDKNLIRSIALWKDGFGEMRKIVLPQGDHAAVITINAWRKRETSLDGRIDETAFSWRLTSVATLKADDDKIKPWIMNGDAEGWSKKLN